MITGSLDSYMIILPSFEKYASVFTQDQYSPSSIGMGSMFNSSHACLFPRLVTRFIGIAFTSATQYSTPKELNAILGDMVYKVHLFIR